MARQPGEEDEAVMHANVFNVTVDDVNKLRVTSTDVIATVPYESASIAVPVLTGSNASATAVISGTEHLVLANPGSTEMGLTLPAAAGVKGQTYTVKKVGGSADVLLSGASGEPIDAWTFVTIESISSSLSVTSDGNRWNLTGLLSQSKALY